MGLKTLVNKVCIALLVVSILLSLPLTPVTASLNDTTSIVASADTSIFEDYPDNNYGSNNYLDVLDDNGFLLIYFDVAMYVGISNATLKINIQSITGSNFYVNVHKITASWTESTTTWNTFGSAYDSEINATLGPFVGVDIWYSVDITTLVLAWSTGEVTNYGLLLKMNVTGNWIAVRSSEFVNGPTLDLTYDSIPEMSKNYLIIYYHRIKKPNYPFFYFQGDYSRLNSTLVEL